MKMIKQGRILESGKVGVTSYIRLVSTTNNVEHSQEAYYERLIKFAKLIGLTEVAPLPETIFNIEKATNEKQSEEAQSIS